MWLLFTGTFFFIEKVWLLLTLFLWRVVNPKKEGISAPLFFWKAVHFNPDEQKAWGNGSVCRGNILLMTCDKVRLFEGSSSMYSCFEEKQLSSTYFWHNCTASLIHYRWAWLDNYSSSSSKEFSHDRIFLSTLCTLITKIVCIQIRVEISKTTMDDTRNPPRFVEPFAGIKSKGVAEKCIQWAEGFLKSLK